MFNDLLIDYGFNGSFKISKNFSNDRNIDKTNALDYLEYEYGIFEIPDGYILHHGIENGNFQIVREDVHNLFRHYGGYYNK